MYIQTFICFSHQPHGSDGIKDSRNLERERKKQKSIYFILLLLYLFACGFVYPVGLSGVMVRDLQQILNEPVSQWAKWDLHYNCRITHSLFEMKSITCSGGYADNLGWAVKGLPTFLWHQQCVWNLSFSIIFLLFLSLLLCFYITTYISIQNVSMFWFGFCWNSPLTRNLCNGSPQWRSGRRNVYINLHKVDDLLHHL